MSKLLDHRPHGLDVKEGAALAANAGNQARTAAALGIGASTLYRKLKRYARRRAR